MNEHPTNKRKRLLWRWSALSAAATLVLAVAILAATRENRRAVPSVGRGVEGVTSVLSRDAIDQGSPIHFADVTDAAGLIFSHFPATRASLLPEDMGSGVAVGDFDDDGWPDLLLVNIAGNATPEASVDAARGRSRLFRNMDGTHFEDVTEGSGIDFVSAGMGACWGDYDDDDDLDLYITAFGPNALYENLGHGSFREITAAVGVTDSRFSTGCSWADYDRDGHLDLYVANYVDFIYREADRRRTERQYATEQPYTINPSAYAPQSNTLFRNKGNGTFEEVAAAAGVDDPGGRSLSASWVDFDQDGWLDLYVANDVSNNGMFRNNGDGTFEDIGASSLAADYRGAMGIAVADFDDDLDEDLLITHWIAQENALYRNMLIDPMLDSSQTGRIWFMDEADAYGLGQSSLDMVGWATGFCDFDNDGRRDLWIVNGSTLETAADHTRLEAQRPFLYYNRGEDGFVEVAGQAAAVLGRPVVGRGGAHLDFNRDGLVDWVISIHGGRPLMLRNISADVGRPQGSARAGLAPTPPNHFLRLDLRQPNRNTRAIGTRAYVTAGGRTQLAVVGSGSSYLSQNELTLHFGLGDTATVETLRVVWPDGVEDIHRNVPTNRAVTVMRGTGVAGGS